METPGEYKVNRGQLMENKDKLKIKINEFIDAVIDKADVDDKLDYFNIEVSNHQGNLQMDYSLRDRKKVY